VKPSSFEDIVSSSMALSSNVEGKASRMVTIQDDPPRPHLSETIQPFRRELAKVVVSLPG
jgi:hypothetical protein